MTGSLSQNSRFAIAGGYPARLWRGGSTSVDFMVPTSRGGFSTVKATLAVESTTGGAAVEVPAYLSLSLPATPSALAAQITFSDGSVIVTSASAIFEVGWAADPARVYRIADPVRSVPAGFENPPGSGNWVQTGTRAAGGVAYRITSVQSRTQLTIADAAIVPPPSYPPAPPLTYVATGATAATSAILMPPPGDVGAELVRSTATVTSTESTISVELPAAADLMQVDPSTGAKVRTPMLIGRLWVEPRGTRAVTLTKLWGE